VAIKPKENLIVTPAFIFSYVGLLGYVIFFLLRPSIDLTSGSSISHTATTAQQKIHQLNSILGYDSSNQSSMAFRVNNFSLWTKLNEQHSGRTTPQNLNRNQIPLNYWRITIGEKYKEAAILMGDSRVFSDVGVLQTRLSDTNQILSIATKTGSSPLFYETDLNINDFNYLISELFGFSLNNYVWADEAQFADLSHPESLSSIDSSKPITLPDAGIYRLTKVSPSIAGPSSIALHYTAGVRASDNEEVIKGIIIDQFETVFSDEPSEVTTSEDISNRIIISAIFLVGTLIIIGLIVLITGLRQIFKGRVEWKRGITIFILITLAQFLWTFLFYRDNLYNFIGSGIVYLDMVQQLFISMLFGLFVFMSYISWESLARDLKSQQIPVIDAFWSGKLFQKQVGAGILSGYGMAGFYLGIFALLMYAFNGVYYPVDSISIGARDLSSAIPAAFIGLNAGTSAAVIVLAQVGILYCLIAYLVHNDIARIAITTILTGITLYSLSKFFSTGLSDIQTIIIFVTLALPLVLAYRYFGIISAFISWFILLIIVRSTGLIGTDNPELLINAVSLGIILLIPFIIGLVGLKGDSINSYKEFAPEYEALQDKKLRSEKELAIAKESQYALMPASAPEVPGFDIRGFFVPSYEVGGDFYDYEVIYDAFNQPTAVAVAIVDVSGKAMKSAINAVFTSGLLLSRIQTDQPEHILQQVNPILCKKTDSRTFVTCQIGRVDLNTKIMQLANAGHCLPLLKRNGETQFIKTNGPRFPLGMRPNVRYEATEVQLITGDILILYSDGLAEAQNQKGKRLEFDDILKLVNDLPSDTMTAQDICASLKKFILSYSDYELVDDTTVICLKVV